MNSTRKKTRNYSRRKRGGGPRSASGKLIASGNSRKHGLAARRPPPLQEIDRLAKALCGESDDEAVLAQARIVAANELTLRTIDQQKLAVVERVRDPARIALIKGDNSRTLATARFLQAWLANKDIGELVPKVLEKYKAQLPPEAGTPTTNEFAVDEGIVPIRIKALLEEEELIEAQRQALDIAQKCIREQERDESEALQEAAADLVRLERYERRAWSRQKRALRAFMNIKLTQRSDESAADFGTTRSCL